MRLHDDHTTYHIFLHFEDLKRNIHLTALQENQKADYLVDLIRAGLTDKLKQFLNDRENTTILRDILQTQFQLKIEFGKKHSPGANEAEEGTETVKMILFPIHIAIISKRPEVVDEIGRRINRLPISSVILQDIMEQKVRLPEFKDDQKTYYKIDRKLDGMNAFHLASIYCNASLQALFDIRNRKNFTNFDFSPFLKETNTYLRRTPLYCAVQKRTSKATR